MVWEEFISGLCLQTAFTTTLEKARTLESDKAEFESSPLGFRLDRGGGEVKPEDEELAVLELKSRCCREVTASRMGFG